MRTVIVTVLLLTITLTFTACANHQTEFETEQIYDPYLVLVNKTHKLPENWESVVQIDTVKNSLGEKHQIEHKTYEAYCNLRDELLGQGIQIELDSVYRSIAEQEEIWAYWSADPEKGEKYCEKYLAKPGYSEHHTGLAVDIFIIKDGKEIRENDDMLADTEDFAIIHKLLPKYGFILRYPVYKEYSTGYAYEPWHLRYINNPEAAAAISTVNVTLEEYLNEQ